MSENEIHAHVDLAPLRVRLSYQQEPGGEMPIFAGGIITGIVIAGFIGFAFADQKIIDENPVMTLATVMIGFFTAALVVMQAMQHQRQVRIAEIHHQRQVDMAETHHQRQVEIERANYAVTLHDRRLEVLKAIEDFLSVFNRDGRPSIDEAAILRSKMRNAHYLFPPEALVVVEKIIEKSFEHHQYYWEWEPLRARAFDGEKLTTEEVEKKKAALKNMHKLARWFWGQLEDKSYRAELEPYLKLPPSV